MYNYLECISRAELLQRACQLAVLQWLDTAWNTPSNLTNCKPFSKPAILLQTISINLGLFTVAEKQRHGKTEKPVLVFV